MLELDHSSGGGGRRRRRRKAEWLGGDVLVVFECGVVALSPESWL